MGHVKMRLVPQGTLPRDLGLGVRMRRLLPGEDPRTGRRRRTFGPPTPGDSSGGSEGCVAECAAMVVTTDPSPIDFDAPPFIYYVWPTEASVLCEGDCLEWSMELDGYAGSGITMEAGEDCVGAIVTVDDTPENLNGVTITLQATLNGSPFCAPVGISPWLPECEPECTGWTYPLGDTFAPMGLDEFVYLQIKMDGNDCLCDELYASASFTVGVTTAAMNTTEPVYVGDCTWQFQVFNANGDDLTGEQVQVDATVDFGGGPFPVCGTALFTCSP